MLYHCQATESSTDAKAALLIPMASAKLKAVGGAWQDQCDAAIHAEIMLASGGGTTPADAQGSGEVHMCDQCVQPCLSAHKLSITTMLVNTVSAKQKPWTCSTHSPMSLKQISSIRDDTIQQVFLHQIGQRDSSLLTTQSQLVVSLLMLSKHACAITHERAEMLEQKTSKAEARRPKSAGASTRSSQEA